MNHQRGEPDHLTTVDEQERVRLALEIPAKRRRVHALVVLLHEPEHRPAVAFSQ
jgi:hypothetical protein